MNIEVVGLILSITALFIFAYQLYAIRKASKSHVSETDDKLSNRSHTPDFVLVRWLQTLGIDFSGLVLTLLIVTIIFSVSGIMLWLFPDRLVWLSPVIVGLISTGLFSLSVLAKSKTMKLEQELITALPSMRALLSSGFSIEKVLNLTARSSSKALARELREVSKRLNLGLPIDRAVDGISRRHNCEGIRLFIQALISRTHTQVDLGLMLRAINELMTVRIKQRMAFSAQISSARYTAMFTASLPYLLIPLIYSQEKTWFEPVIEQRAGMTVLIVALGLQLLGFYWLHKISRSYQ